MTRNSSGAMRAALVALMCAVGLLAVGAAPAAAADPCVDVRFIAVRGSGEAGGVAGNAANAINDAMQQYVPAGATTALTGIDYAAVGLDLAGIGKTVGTLGWRYQSSKSGGVRNLDAYLDSQVSCPTERWVLLGFSQGAHVIGDALSAADGTLDAAQQAKVAAVVLLADPRFNPQESFVAGTYNIARYGLAGKRPKGDLTRAVGKIKSWCDSDDLVCQGVGTDNAKSVHSGTRYVSAHKDAITSFLRGKLAWSSSSGGTPSGYTGPIDVAFAIDTTGSMGDDIARVSSAAISLFNKLKASGANARVGLVDYKDTNQGDPYGARLDLPFTSDATAFANAIGALSVSGGGDYPEAVLSGVQTAIDALSWRPGAKKVIIALGDAPGKDPEPVTGLTTPSVLQAAYALDPAQIYSVVLDPNATAFFKTLSDGSAGELFQVTDPTTITDVLGTALLTAVSSPVAVLSPVEPAQPGTEVSFSAADSYDPSGQDLVSYSWDFDGDGTADATTSTPFASHVYPAPFSGSAAVTVTNVDGTMATGSTPVTITSDTTIAPAPPLAVTNLRATTNGTEVTATWDAPSGRVDDYLVTLTEAGAGDPVAGGTTPDPSITFTDAVPGTYLLTVTPVNGAGFGPEASATITIGAPGDQVTISFRDTAGKVTVWGGLIEKGDVRINPAGDGAVTSVGGYVALDDSPTTRLLLLANRTRFGWAGALHARWAVSGPDLRLEALVRSVRRTATNEVVVTGPAATLAGRSIRRGTVTVTVTDSIKTPHIRGPDW